MAPAHKWHSNVLCTDPFSPVIGQWNLKDVLASVFCIDLSSDVSVLVCKCWPQFRCVTFGLGLTLLISVRDYLPKFRCVCLSSNMVPLAWECLCQFVDLIPGMCWPGFLGWQAQLWSFGLITAISQSCLGLCRPQLVCFELSWGLSGDFWVVGLSFYDLDKKIKTEAHTSLCLGKCVLTEADNFKLRKTHLLSEVDSPKLETHFLTPVLDYIRHSYLETVNISSRMCPLQLGSVDLKSDVSVSVLCVSLRLNASVGASVLLTKRDLLAFYSLWSIGPQRCSSTPSRGRGNENNRFAR